MVVEGAGLNEEEAELTGDGSMEDAESIQRAESSDEVELFRLVDLRAFIQACSMHATAVILFLERVKEAAMTTRTKDNKN